MRACRRFRCHGRRNIPDHSLGEAYGVHSDIITVSMVLAALTSTFVLLLKVSWLVGR